MSTKAMTPINEISLKERFSFGRNWLSYSKTIDQTALEKSKASMLAMLQIDNLVGKSFLDIGSGSGLSSLSAQSAGATSVVSFDFDPLSVECTRKTKCQFFPASENWTITRGSVLDRDFMLSLGTFDCVYSWGVLHHTGNMTQAFKNVVPLVKPGGKLFISIYNDQGTMSRIWLAIKRVYNALPRFLRPAFTLAVALPFELRSLLIHVLRWELLIYLKSWMTKQIRGMNRFYDWIDWVGGYPFEVAKPEVVFDFFKSQGFVLERLKTCGGGLACNEYVFVKK